jgi:hypothetical protein
VSVKEILKTVRALSPEDRAQVRALLDTLPGCWVNRPASGNRPHAPHAGRDKGLAAFADNRR